MPQIPPPEPGPHTDDNPSHRRNTLLLTCLPLVVLMGIGSSTLHSDQINRHVGDLSLYARASDLLMHGRLPYRDFAFEYPPLSLLPLTLPRWLALGHALATQTYLTLFLAENAVFAAVIAAVIAQLAPRFPAEGGGTAQRNSALTLYTLLIVIGSPLLPWRFDLFPALLTALALRSVLRGRPTVTGLWLGLGIAAKLYPVVLLPPIALYYLAQRQRPSVAALLLGALGGLGLGLLPFAPVGLPTMLSFLSYHTHRGLEVGSLPAGGILLLREWGLTTASVVFNFGAFHVASPMSGALILWLPVVFLVVYCVVQASYSRRFRDDVGASGSVRPETLVAALVAALLAFIVTNKVFSPQYLVWILPFAPLLGQRFKLGFTVLWGLTIAIFPFAFPFLVTLAPAAVLLLNLRNGSSVFMLVFLLRGQGRASSPARRPALPTMRDEELEGLP